MLHGAWQWDVWQQLRPVTFTYKPEVDPSGSTQYGLIAEEVAEVFPDLVARGYLQVGQPWVGRRWLTGPPTGTIELTSILHACRVADERGTEIERIVNDWIRRDIELIKSAT